MLWNQVRQAYPSQWLIIEALEAQTMPAIGGGPVTTPSAP